MILDSSTRRKWIVLAKRQLTTGGLWDDSARPPTSIHNLNMARPYGAVMFAYAGGDMGVGSYIVTTVLKEGEAYIGPNNIYFLIVVPIMNNAVTGEPEALGHTLYRQPGAVGRTHFYLNAMAHDCGFDNEHVAKARKLFEADWVSVELDRSSDTPSDYDDRRVSNAWYYFLRGYTAGCNSLD